MTGHNSDTLSPAPGVVEKSEIGSPARAGQSAQRRRERDETDSSLSDEDICEGARLAEALQRDIDRLDHS
jgi:hypothetical protein